MLTRSTFSRTDDAGVRRFIEDQKRLGNSCTTTRLASGAVVVQVLAREADKPSAARAALEALFTPKDRP